MSVLLRRPFRLWGLSLLFLLLCGLANMFSGMVPLLGLALTALLTVGMTMTFLRGYLNEDIRIENLFEGFRDWNTVGRLLAGMGMMYLKVFLWSLIPFAGLVFAIIKSYAYRLTPYILVHEPEIKASQAYKVSEQRTQGYKGRMFWADILWSLIVFAAITILALLAQIPYAGFLFGIVAGLVGLVVSLFGPLFSGLIESAFYVEIQRAIGVGPQFDDSMNEIEIFSKREKPPVNKVCPVCGAVNVAAARFCSGCGFSFETAERSSSEQ